MNEVPLRQEGDRGAWARHASMRRKGREGNTNQQGAVSQGKGTMRSRDSMFAWAWDSILRTDWQHSNLQK